MPDQQQIVLVRACRQLYLDSALLSRGAYDPDAYREDCVIVPQGTIGIIEGESKWGEECKIVSFERPGDKGFITQDVRVTHLTKI